MTNIEAFVDYLRQEHRLKQNIDYAYMYAASDGYNFLVGEMWVDVIITAAREYKLPLCSLSVVGRRQWSQQIFDKEALNG